VKITRNILLVILILTIAGCASRVYKVKTSDSQFYYNPPLIKRETPKYPFRVKVEFDMDIKNQYLYRNKLSPAPDKDGLYYDGFGGINSKAIDIDEEFIKQTLIERFQKNKVFKEIGDNIVKEDYILKINLVLANKIKTILDWEVYPVIELNMHLVEPIENILVWQGETEKESDLDIAKTKDAGKALNIYINLLEAVVDEGIAEFENKTGETIEDNNGPCISISGEILKENITIVENMQNILISGSAADRAGIRSVKLNKKDAVLEKSDEGAEFSGEYRLDTGYNEIIIEATDNKGNKTIKTYLVKNETYRKNPEESKKEPDFQPLIVDDDKVTDEYLKRLRNDKGFFDAQKKKWQKMLEYSDKVRTSGETLRAAVDALVIGVASYGLGLLLQSGDLLALGVISTTCSIVDFVRFPMQPSKTAKKLKKEKLVEIGIKRGFIGGTEDLRKYSINAFFNDSTGNSNNILELDEEAEIVMTVSNFGELNIDGSVYLKLLKPELKVSKTPYKLEEAIVFGTVKPHTARVKRFPVKGAVFQEKGIYTVEVYTRIKCYGDYSRNKKVGKELLKSIKLAVGYEEYEHPKTGHTEKPYIIVSKPDIKKGNIITAEKNKIIIEGLIRDESELGYLIINGEEVESKQVSAGLEFTELLEAVPDNSLIVIEAKNSKNEINTKILKIERDRKKVKPHIKDEVITPLNISLWIPFWKEPISLFKNATVIGLDFGPLATRAKKVYGVQLGIASYVDEYIYGIQMGFFYCKTKNLYGIQLFPAVSDIENVGKGIQLGFYNRCNKFYGFQYGMLNSANRFKGFQIGYMNYNIGRRKKKTKRYLGEDPVYIKHNNRSPGFGKMERFEGVQCAMCFNSVEEFRGVQIGVVNISDNCKGVQFGALNWCTTLQGVQIGGLNIIKKSRLIPLMVGVNISW
jgi:hypothetical protein